MSMMKTLAKVAVGVAVAKAAKGMMSQSGSNSATRNAGSGGLFGGLNSPQPQQQQGGGLEDLLGAVLGGQSGSAPQSGGLGGQLGGLGGLLEQLGGAQSQSGGLNDLLGGLQGTQQPGGLGGLLGALTGAAGAAKTSKGGFGDLLNQAIAGQNEPKVTPSRGQEAAAELMLRAMIQAMKSDGQIDQAEQQKLLGRLGDVSASEQKFVQGEMQKPVDVQGLAREVPRGLEQQVYAMSVMGIDLDNQSEAQYLHQFAEALNIGKAEVNQIHAQLGVPQIYS